MWLVVGLVCGWLGTSVAMAPLFYICWRRTRHLYERSWTASDRTLADLLLDGYEIAARISNPVAKLYLLSKGPALFVCGELMSADMSFALELV